MGKTVWKMIQRKKSAAGSERQSWRTLGILGAGRGVGVTHTAVWSANYLTGVQRKKTAVLEWNDHLDFEKIGQFCRANRPASVTGWARIGSRTERDRTAASFRILDVDYFEKAGAAVLAECLSRNYHRILVDFGEATEESRAECARCDRKLVIGSLAEWKAGAFLELTERSREWDDSWCLAVAFGSRETRKTWEKAFGKSCLSIPFSEDAYLVRWEDMRFFHALFE